LRPGLEMENKIVFDTIQITAPRESILARLGYREGITKLGVTQREKVEQYIQEALSFITLKGVARRLVIQEKNNLEIVLSPEVIFKSQRLAEFIGESKELILMGATAGQEIMSVIQRETSRNNLSGAVVFDAVASEMVDASLDWIMDYYNRQLLRENKQVTKNRFSAGYGDFLLENQKLIFELLDLSSLGVSLTKKCMLIPEKSVTAIAAIKGAGR
jgi:hypothetical protein